MQRSWFLRKTTPSSHICLSIKPRYVWDYLSDTGFRVVVANAPNVYYVKEIDVILISGWLHLDDSSIAYPAETPGELNELRDECIVDILYPES